MGNMFWTYIGTVTLSESALSIASLTFWICIFFMSTCTVYTFKILTVAGTFFAFGGITLLGGVLFACSMKEINNIPKEKLPLLYLSADLKKKVIEKSIDAMNKTGSFMENDNTALLDNMVEE